MDEDEIRSCQINWRAFGLEPPDATECDCPAACLVIQGCPHEHITKALACWHHLAYMRSLESLDMWGCAACLQGASGHQCRAPVLMRVIPGRPCGAARSEGRTRIRLAGLSDLPLLAAN